jgi:hypothetical protein
MPDTGTAPLDDPDGLIAGKVAWRLAPLLMLCYFVAFLDRVNVGFAALTMNADLGFDSAVFGFGAGIFFIGYFFFEVPSNLVLEKVGARLWIARSAISVVSLAPTSWAGSRTRPANIRSRHSSSAAGLRSPA